MLSQLLDAFSSGDKDTVILTVILMLLTLPIVLLSLSLHEAAHALAAHKLGDRTARNLGRLTANPAKHLDPLGAICMFLFGIGWAKPVPINARNFKNPKWGMAISAFAGPLCNLTLSLVGTILCQLTFRLIPLVCDSFFPVFYAGMPASNLIMLILVLFFELLAYYNAALAIFNLLPIPPFDGSRLAFVLLPDKWYFEIMKYERYIMLGLLVLLATDILTLPIDAAATSITDFFFNITSFIGG